jgi:hypothetical protein
MNAAAAHAALADLYEEGRRCRTLWCSVIARIVMDATRADDNGDAARAWLRAPDPMVLALLDLDPEAAAPALARIALRFPAEVSE